MFTGSGARWSAIAVAAMMLTGCNSGARRQADDPPDSAAGETAQAENSPPVISEDVWVGLASLPRSHLMRAREMFMVDQKDDAARDFEAAGALVRLEAAHAGDAGLRHRLESAGIELRELGHTLQRQGSAPIEEVDDVMTRAYLALAEAHGNQAARAFQEGRSSPAATYLEQSAAELQRAYERSSVQLTKQTKSTLLDAHEAARRLSTDGSQNAIKVARAALGALEKDSTQLEKALGAHGR
jgi:hypothetical protein